MQQSRSTQIHAQLLDWYDKNKRDLPWRHSQHPYAIWISEIMAQQTRITALLPYYERFMKQFPTVQALAEAHEDAVLKAWEGLGYYSRAKNLYKAAKIVTERYVGVLPAEKQALLSLPGIGEYTAGAILSIAFGQAVPAVDGNVLRVFSRVEESELDIMQPQTKTVATEFVKACMPTDRAGYFTQALMELGALVCLPKSPLCGECPLCLHCLAYENEHQGLFPVKTAKKPPRRLDKTVLEVFDGVGNVLVRQRTEKLLGGLWEYVLLDGDMTVSEASSFLEQQGFSVQNATETGRASHVFTHMVWNMKGFLCLVDKQPPPEGYVWVRIEKLTDLALPTALKYFTNDILSR